MAPRATHDDENRYLCRPFFVPYQFMILPIIQHTREVNYKYRFSNSGIYVPINHNSSIYNDVFNLNTICNRS